MPEDDVPFALRRLSPADVTPEEFEQVVASICQKISPRVESLEVILHEHVETPDGTFDIDVTVRFRFGGMDFKVLVEAKHHVRPIERSLVQVLNDKVHSARAHKGVLMSTSPFQSGALAYARSVGIGLVHVTDEGMGWLAHSAILAAGSVGSDGPVARHWEFDGESLHSRMLDDSIAVWALLVGDTHAL